MPKTLSSRLSLILMAIFLAIGAALVGLSLRMPQAGELLERGAELVVAAIAFALVAALLVFNLLTRRLRLLADAMEAFRASRFAQAPVLAWSRPDGDEIDRLAHAFGELAERIARQLAELADMDAQRRELLANVSHDLRTPLTLMQGYLQTLLLRRGEMSAAEERDCLEVATRHAERLSGLVADLFELTKLDRQAIQPEPFALTELAQDIAQKFSLHAAPRGVRIAVDLQAATPPVLGDIGLLERALENLVENALRHTPDGGQVRIAVHGGAGRVQVQVRDTGCGIAQEHLPHVFDRYYRAPRREAPDNAAAEWGRHAGLGLAITQRVVALHGGEIRVDSTVGRGTVFSFDLAAAPQGAP